MNVPLIVCLGKDGMGLVENHKSSKVFMRPCNNRYVAAVNGGPHPKKIKPP